MTGSSPKCGGEFEFANYEVANYHFYGPRWIHLSNGTKRYYLLEHNYVMDWGDYAVDYGRWGGPVPEIWTESSGRWRTVQRQQANQIDILRRYRELSPHYVLGTVLRRSKDVDVDVVARASGVLTLRATFDSQGDYYSGAEIVVVLDEQSYEILGYDVELPDGPCSLLELSARDGQYGIDIEFPDAVHADSRHLSSCRPHDLGLLSRTITREDLLPGSCGSDPARNVRRYHFSLDAPQTSVTISVHRHYLTLSLLEDSGPLEIISRYHSRTIRPRGRYRSRTAGGGLHYRNRVL